MDTLTLPTMWSKSHPAWGQRRRIQRNAYAFKVTMRMTNGRMECPACLNPLDLDTAEVDRAVPGLDYAPGNICYLCRGCNQGRGVLQSVGKDWSRVTEYVSDIATASVGIVIPTEAEAKRWHDARPTVATVSRYA
jgi:hypothetical protein